jgi:hypothetical protein
MEGRVSTFEIQLTASDFWAINGWVATALEVYQRLPDVSLVMGALVLIVGAFFLGNKRKNTNQTAL